MKKAKGRPKIKRPRCRLCRELCEPNKLLYDRDFREKLQDIACIWIQILPGFGKYHVCSTCQNEVEVFYSFKKRCRHILHGGIPTPEMDNDHQLQMRLNSLLENYSEEAILPPGALESLASTSLTTDSKTTDGKSHENLEDVEANEPKEQVVLTKDPVPEPVEPQSRKKVVKKTKIPNATASDKAIASDGDHAKDDAKDPESTQPIKKTRPYRRRFRETEEEKSLTEEGYKRHYRKQYWKNYKQICDICGKSIDNQRMESHMNRHNGVEPYCCEECGLQFHCRANLRKHINRSHVKGQEVTCEICHRVSISEIAHKQHLKAVHAERRFQCTLCDVKTVTQHALDQHMDIHNQKRDFVCPHCGKAFYRKYVLNIHLRTHSGEAPYKCHVCEKAFVHRRMYVLHMKKHHPDEPLMRVDGTRALKEALIEKIRFDENKTMVP